MTTTLAPVAHLHRYLPWGFTDQHEALVAIADGVDVPDFLRDRLDEVLTSALSCTKSGRLLEDEWPWDATIDHAAIRLRGLRPWALPAIVGDSETVDVYRHFQMFLFAVGVAMTPHPAPGAPRRPMTPYAPVMLRKLWAGISTHPFPEEDFREHLAAVMDVAHTRLVARGRTAGNANEVAQEVWGMSTGAITAAGTMPHDSREDDIARLTRVAILSMSRAAGLTTSYKA